MNAPIPIGLKWAEAARRSARALRPWRARWAVGWLPILLMTLLSGGWLAAQEAGSLAQVDARYRSAEQAHQAALAAAEAQRLLLDDELARVALAREEDEDALAQALRRFLPESAELRRLEDRARDTEQSLLDARQAFLATLDQERITLEGQLAVASDTRTTQLILDRLQGLTSQYQELDRASPEQVPASLFSQSTVSFDVRDGRDEFQTKAELLELRARDADSLIVQFDKRVERLESRLRLEQNSRDFLGGVERFGDAQLPAIAPRPESVREEGVPLDAGEIAENVPLEQRIEELRQLQERLRQSRDMDLTQARAFRERLLQIIE